MIHVSPLWSPAWLVEQTEGPMFSRNGFDLYQRWRNANAQSVVSPIAARCPLGVGRASRHRTSLAASGIGRSSSACRSATDVKREGQCLHGSASCRGSRAHERPVGAPRRKKGHRRLSKTRKPEPPPAVAIAGSPRAEALSERRHDAPVADHGADTKTERAVDACHRSFMEQIAGGSVISARSRFPPSAVHAVWRTSENPIRSQGRRAMPNTDAI